MILTTFRLQYYIGGLISGSGYMRELRCLVQYNTGTESAEVHVSTCDKSDVCTCSTILYILKFSRDFSFVNFLFQNYLRGLSSRTVVFMAYMN